jgi:cytoskeletal protein CcmA (bactofilin family)
MALFGREDRESRSERTQATQEPQRPGVAPPGRESAPEAAPRRIEPEVGEVNAHLGRGSRVTGRLFFDGTVRVDGQVEGEISAQDTLIVGESAVVTAQITGATVIIRGKVTGDINAKKRVEIRAPGKLYGNIVTPSLVIHEGVTFEGHCSMGTLEAKVSERKVTPLPREEKGGDGTLAKVSSDATR